MGRKKKEQAPENKALSNAPENKSGAKEPKQKSIKIKVIKEYAGIKIGTILKGKRSKYLNYMTSRGYWEVK